MGGDLGGKALSDSGHHILSVVWPGPLSMPEDGFLEKPREEPGELSGWIQYNCKGPQLRKKEAEGSQPE